MRSLVQGRRNERWTGVAGWCTTTLLALTAVVLGAAPVPAHTELVSSSPKDGASVTTLPAMVELTFSEPVGSRGLFVVVTDPAGAQVAVGKPDVSDDTVRQATNGRGPAGDYTLVYRVVSADGHPVSGELRFVVEEGSAPGSAPEPQSSAEPDEGFVSRYAGQLGLAGAGLAAVGVLVGVGVRGRRTRD